MMSSPVSELLDVVRKRREEGQRSLAQAIKSLVYHASASTSELLDFANDRVFLEPLLFAHFHSSGSALELGQLLYGLTEESLRPSTLAVAADEEGIVHLPEFAYLRTELPAAEFVLTRAPSSGELELHYNGTRATFDITMPIRVPGTDLEVMQGCHPLLRGFFIRPTGSSQVVFPLPQSQIVHLNRALSLIAEFHPRYHQELLAVTKKVLIYHADYPYSFASMTAHGIAFLNAAPASGEVFFIEDLIHQAGHILFSSVTLDRQSLFAIDPDRKMTDITGIDLGDASLYEAFHGLFTQANINTCLAACYEAEVFAGIQEHELVGRFADDMKRFASALALLRHRALYSPDGWEFVELFRDIFEGLESRHEALIQSVDTSNQPYIFNYKRFEELNPRSLRSAGLAEGRSEVARAATGPMALQDDLESGG
jgi:hypothetical protein